MRVAAAPAQARRRPEYVPLGHAHLCSSSPNRAANFSRSLPVPAAAKSDQAGWGLTALSDGRSTVRSYRCWCSQPAHGLLVTATPGSRDAGGGGHIRAAQVGDASAMEYRSDP